MSIWNLDAQKRQRCLTWAELCYIMSISNNLSYLLVNIMLLSKDRVAIIFTAKFEIDNIAFTKNRQFWRSTQLKQGLNYTICLFYDLSFGRQCYLFGNLVAYTQSQIEHPVTFGSQISHFKCDAYRLTVTAASDLKRFVGGVYVGGASLPYLSNSGTRSPDILFSCPIHAIFELFDLRAICMIIYYHVSISLSFIGLWNVSFVFTRIHSHTTKLSF